MLRISGVVILYQPDESVPKNIQSYLDCIDKLYVIDNSDLVDSRIVNDIKKNDKCLYVNNRGNQGIAHALNVGVNMAIADDSNWVLTMDQDSYFEKGMLKKMIDWLQINSAKNIGIMSPVHQLSGDDVSGSNEVVDVTSVFTSGNLLNISAYRDVGTFREDFFIDFVDHEYCLRLKKSNYKVLLNQQSILRHSLGDLKSIRFLGRNIFYSNHDYVRCYYITRNRLKVIRMYFFYQPIFCLKEVKYFFSSWVKIIFLEKDVVLKQKSMLLGIWHFLRGVSGKNEF